MSGGDAPPCVKTDWCASGDDGDELPAGAVVVSMSGRYGWRVEVGMMTDTVGACYGEAVRILRSVCALGGAGGLGKPTKIGLWSELKRATRRANA